jgi:hypothetical protein
MMFTASAVPNKTKYVLFSVECVFCWKLPRARKVTAKKNSGWHRERSNCTAQSGRDFVNRKAVKNTEGVLCCGVGRGSCCPSHAWRVSCVSTSSTAWDSVLKPWKKCGKCEVGGGNEKKTYLILFRMKVLTNFAFAVFAKSTCWFPWICQVLPNGNILP